MGKRTMSHHPFEYLWRTLCCAVDSLSIEQTVKIGGTSSVASIAAATVPDFTALNAYLQTAALGAGALGAFLSIGLIVLKGWLELKRHRQQQPPS
jgi:hypothetical protein